MINRSFINTIALKTTAVLCILSAALPLLFTAFFLFRQLYIIHEMKEQLEMASLHTIELKKEDFKWVKHEKEISVGGELFDVKDYEVKNGNYKFAGLYDREETAIENGLGLLSGTNGDDQFSLSHLLVLLQTVYIPSQDETTRKIETLPLNICSDFISPLSQQPHAVWTPPPQAKLLFCMM